jgi:DHA1 family multidrug resistance protein-like MFS transporter
MTGVGLSLVTPFLPLYIETLGDFSKSTLTFWSGLTIAVPFLVSTIVSPLWGRLADRSGRKPMLLRAAIGMAVAMLLTGFVTNIYQLLILRIIFGLFSGFISNATALIATQVPKEESGRVLGTLNTAGIGGVLLGPIFGGAVVSLIGYAHVFIITGAILGLVFLLSIWRVRENFTPIPKAEMQSGRQVIQSLKNPRLILGAIMITTIFALTMNSINPILSLFVRELVPAGGNIELLAGLTAAAPGLTTILLGSRLGALGDRIGSHKVLMGGLVLSAVLFLPMFFVTQVWQLIGLRLFLGIANAVMLPSVQTMLTLNSPIHSLSRVFAYNQSAQSLGSVLGPLVGSAIGGILDYRYVFLATFVFAAINFVVAAMTSRRLQPVDKASNADKTDDPEVAQKP